MAAMARIQALLGGERITGPLRSDFDLVAVVPQERNALINVRHPAMARVRTIREKPFRVDPRLG